MTWRRAKTVAQGWVPNRHGIPSSYNRGCRCDECRRANADRQARNGAARANYKARKAERVEVDGRLVHPAPYGGHGTLTAYTSCSCRCGPCRDAAAGYLAARRRAAS